METYKTTFTIKRLWILLAVSMIVMFSTLLLFGREIYQQAPPIPQSYQTNSGEVVYTRAHIQRGQNVWQSIGGMQQGSVWGHGSYLAPDWTADWLHREAEALLEIMVDGASALTQLPNTPIEKVYAIALRSEMRENTYDSGSGIVTISEKRAQAIQEVAHHYQRLFQGTDEDYFDLRKDYAFPLHSTLSEEDAEDLAAFIFWSSWSAVTNRPGDDISYTSNWPHDPLVGNTPTPSVYMWSIISVLLLLAGIGALVWYYVRQHDVWRADMEPETGFSKNDILANITITPSMMATAKYFWVVSALFLVQILLGIVTAHYAVEG
ncbi:MAG: hypothetical protein RIB43_17325 [Rhodospirillaceae bacterium]